MYFKYPKSNRKIRPYLDFKTEVNSEEVKKEIDRVTSKQNRKVSYTRIWVSKESSQKIKSSDIKKSIKSILD